MSIDVKYRANAIAVGGRDGRASTPDGTLDLKLATPREVGGAGGNGTNPEQLFAAGYGREPNGCFAARKLSFTENGSSTPARLLWHR